jgi:DNA repair exonuclease SbcCD nuclease subunit
MKFLHTADWQLGKPYARVTDTQKCAQLQLARIHAIARIGQIAREHQAEFIVVAGDLFDSPTASNATVAAACSAIGQLDLPVWVIPGNHDHGGPGGLWEQDFFQRQCAALASNLHILIEPAPVELPSAWLFPCPLLRRAEATDTTAWLRAPEALARCGPDKPRIVLAHGSTQQFIGRTDDDETDAGGSNQINLARLPDGAFDYVALGDWHGTKKVTANAWFSGTPETDRFPKGADHDPGNVLVVTAERGQPPTALPIRTGGLKWHSLSFDFAADSSVVSLQEKIDALIANRTNEDLLLLDLTGSLGVEAAGSLEQLIESLEARLLRLKLSNQATVAPTDAETQALTRRPSDPLTARVAAQLVQLATGADETAATARIALRELHAACKAS